jgi:hypothetical protein
MPLISFLSQVIKESIPFSSYKKQVNSQIDVKQPLIPSLCKRRDVVAFRGTTAEET